MKRKRYLMDHIKLFLIGILITASLFVVVLGLDYYYGGTYTLYILIASPLLFLVGLLYFFQTIYKPYIQIKKTYQSFVDGKIYDELFRNPHQLSLDLELVFDKFKTLLNKSDLLHASKQQAQYLALQNQINPHFLYNTLESIRSDALCGGMEDIARITEALSFFFRYTISDVERTSTLNDELENVENYFIIQKYRFGNRLALKINMPEGENLSNLKIPKLTLQPIVENAIIHGLECYTDSGLIEINVEVSDKDYYVTVIDNGTGIPMETLKRINSQLSATGVASLQDTAKKGGIALRNVAQRIKLLFGDEYGIQVYSSVNVGTKVMVWLPIVYRKE